MREDLMLTAVAKKKDCVTQNCLNEKDASKTIAMPNEKRTELQFQVLILSEQKIIEGGKFWGGFTRSCFSLIGLCPRCFIGPSNLCRIGFYFIGP
ncbi:hypothetical protein T03_8634 [Trichinella britovi]|uniref:Uncharacterized protein n=1 Tax=Trichinella britovi TaxID=45882 RepID=A0A0V1AI21_TRIBR|nr:hypothetical protein T03_8634 [Trichinella britovi]